MKSHSSNYTNTTGSLPGCREFQEKALELFKFQYQENFLYRQFSDLFHTVPEGVTDLHQIPFLPVSFLDPKMSNQEISILRLF
jgi:hypothetical protein